MTLPYSFVRDINGYNGYALIPSDERWGVQLVVGRAESLIVPTDSKQYVTYISISAGEVWISDNGIAATPGSIFSKTNSFGININNSNTPYIFKGGTTLSFITDEFNVEISVMFYRTQ